MNPPMPRYISHRQEQQTALSAFGLGEILATWRKRAKDLNERADKETGNARFVLKAQAKQLLDCTFELRAEAEKP